VLGIKDRRDKITRLRSALPKIENGSLLLPKTAPYLDDFLLECLGFPSVKHDDHVDALSQFLNWCTNGTSIFEMDFGLEEDLGAPDPDTLLWRRRFG
jgi:phage terminase large subunit-like protein